MPDVEVHTGFYTQFESLAIQPIEGSNESCVEGAPLSALLQAICNLTQGAYPIRIVSSGFSLGSALSELGGVWAAQLFPGADVSGVLGCVCL